MGIHRGLEVFLLDIQTLMGQLFHYLGGVGGSIGLDGVGGTEGGDDNLPLFVFLYVIDPVVGVVLNGVCFQLSSGFVEQQQPAIATYPHAPLAVRQDGTDAVVSQGILGIVHPVPSEGLGRLAQILDVEHAIATTHPDASLAVATDAEELVARAFACDGGQGVGGQLVVVGHHRDATVGANPDVVVVVAEEAPHGIASQRIINASIVQNVVCGLVGLNDEETVVSADEQVALFVHTHRFGHRHFEIEGVAIPCSIPCNQMGGSSYPQMTFIGWDETSHIIHIGSHLLQTFVAQSIAHHTLSRTYINVGVDGGHGENIGDADRHLGAIAIECILSGHPPMFVGSCDALHVLPFGIGKQSEGVGVEVEGEHATFTANQQTIL